MTILEHKYLYIDFVVSSSDIEMSKLIKDEDIIRDLAGRFLVTHLGEDKYEISFYVSPFSLKSIELFKKKYLHIED